MKRTKICKAYIALLSFLVVIAACSGNFNTSDGTSPGTGAIAFEIVMPGSTVESAGFGTTALNCGFVDTVEATVFDQNDVELANSGPPWPCSQRTGTITGVAAGSNRKVTIVARGFDGNILYQGTKTGITVTANETEDAGTILLTYQGTTVAWIQEGGAVVKFSSAQEELLKVDQVNCSDLSGMNLAVDQNDGGLWMAGRGAVIKLDDQAELVSLMQQRGSIGAAVDSRDGSVWTFEFIDFDYRLVKRTSVGLPIVKTAEGLDPSAVDNTMSWYPGDDSLWWAGRFTGQIVKLFGTDAALDGYLIGGGGSSGTNHIGISTSAVQPYSVSVFPGDDTGGAGHVWASLGDGNVIKYSTDGSELFRNKPSGFFEARHVSADISVGSAWVADGTSDRMAKFAAAGGEPLLNVSGDIVFNTSGFTANTIEADPFDGGAWVGSSAGLYKLTSTGAEEWRRSSGSSVGAIALQTRINQNRMIYVSDSGSDMNGNGSEFNPYKTIGKGIIEANSGDTVLVSAGVYNENIPLKSGIKIVGAGSDVTVIQGLGTTNTVDGRSIQNVTVSGFSITGSGDSGSGVFCSNCNGVIIRGNAIRDNGISLSSLSYGIRIEGGTSALIEQNVITGNPRSGILITGNSSAVVRNNIIANNTRDGIFRGRGDLPCFISNNVIASNGVESIGAGIDTSSDDVIWNNIIVFNGPEASPGTCGGICVDFGASPELSYNNVFSNGTNYEGVSPGIGDISSNPLFVSSSSGNYRLLSGSPSVNSGDPDFFDEGVACTNFNARSDMGAYGGPWGNW